MERKTKLCPLDSHVVTVFLRRFLEKRGWGCLQSPGHAYQDMLPRDLGRTPAMESIHPTTSQEHSV